MNEKYIDETVGFSHGFETPEIGFRPSEKTKGRHRKLNANLRIALTSSILLTALAGCADSKGELIKTPSATLTKVPITLIPTATKPPPETKTSTPPPKATSEAEKPDLTLTPISTSTPEPSPTPEIPLEVYTDQYLQYIEDLKNAGIDEKEAIEMAKEKVKDGWFKTKKVEETTTPMKEEIQTLDWSRGTTPELYKKAGPTVLQTLGIIRKKMELRGEKILYYSDALVEGKRPIGWYIGESGNAFYVLLFLGKEGETPDKADIISVNVESVSGSGDLVYLYFGKGKANIDERGIVYGLTGGYIDGPKQVIIAKKNGEVVSEVQIDPNSRVLESRKPKSFGNTVYIETTRSDIDGYIFINQSGEVVRVSQRDNQGNLVFPRSFNENRVLLSSHSKDNLAIADTAHFELVDLNSDQVISTNLAQAVDNWIKRHPEKCPKGSFRNYHAFPSENGFLVFFDTSPDSLKISNLEYPIVGFKVSNTGQVEQAVTLYPNTLSESGNWPELIMLNQAGMTTDDRYFAFLSSYYDHGEGLTPTLPGLRGSLVKLNLVNLEAGETTRIPLNDSSLVEWYYDTMDKYHWDITGDLDYSGSDTDLARELIVKYGQLNIPQTGEDTFQIRPGAGGNEVWIKLQGGGRIVKPNVLFGEFWSSQDYFPMVDELEKSHLKGQAPDWYEAVRENLPVFYDNLYIKQEVPERWLVVNVNSGKKRVEVIQ